MKKILYLASLCFILSLGFTACDSDEHLLNTNEEEILQKLEGEWIEAKYTTGIPGSKEEQESSYKREPGVRLMIFKNGTGAYTFNGKPEEPEFFGIGLEKAETCWGIKTFSWWIANPYYNSIPSYIIELTDDSFVSSTCGNDVIHTIYYERYKPEEK